MKEIKRLSDEELIFRYVDLNLLKETESMRMEKCDWSIIEKYNDELLIVEDALKSTRESAIPITQQAKSADN